MNDNPPKFGPGVLEKIRSGQVKKRPRYFFALETGFFSAGAFLVFLLMLFLSSFMLFFLRGSGSMLLPALGWQGSKFFLFSFPWMILVSLLVSAVIFEYFIWRFPMVYHHPLFYSAAATVVLSLAFGAAISYTPLHANAFQQAQQETLPLAGGLYRYYSQAALENINFGSPKISLEPEAAPKIETFGGQIFEVKAAVQEESQEAEVLEVLEDLKKSEAVMIFGKKKDSEIEAYGIREMDKDDIPFLHDCRQMTCQKDEDGKREEKLKNDKNGKKDKEQEMK